MSAGMEAMSAAVFSNVLMTERIFGAKTAGIVEKNVL